jgi:hypothetical protein
MIKVRFVQRYKSTVGSINILMESITDKMKKIFLLSVIIPAFLASVFSQENPRNGVSADFSHGKLRISGNGHFLIHEDGTPFFYPGDTAWELFHRLNKEESEKYLENRRAKDYFPHGVTRLIKDGEPGLLYLIKKMHSGMGNGSGKGNDRILVLDDTSKGFKAPGQ